MQVLLHRLDRLLRMDGGGSPDDDGHQPRVLQHLVVVVIEGDTVGFEMLSAPGQLRRVGREGGDKLCLGGEVEKIPGMTFGYAAETGDADFEFGDGHVGAEYKQCMYNVSSRVEGWL